MEIVEKMFLLVVLCAQVTALPKTKKTQRVLRANALRDVLTNSTKANKFDSQVLKESLDLCLSCKACASECPSNVDMSALKAEFLYQYQKENGFSF